MGRFLHIYRFDVLFLADVVRVPHQLDLDYFFSIYDGTSLLSSRVLLESNLGVPHILTRYRSQVLPLYGLDTWGNPYSASPLSTLWDNLYLPNEGDVKVPHQLDLDYFLYIYMVQMKSYQGVP